MFPRLFTRKAGTHFMCFKNYLITNLNNNKTEKSVLKYI